MAEEQNEIFLKFSKWFKITLIVGIFVLISSVLYTTLVLIYWVKEARGLYFKYDPIEFQLIMYIAFLVFAIFRSIWLGLLGKMRKSERKFSLTVFCVIQIVVAISLGILSIFGILISIDEILQEHFLSSVVRNEYSNIILYALAIMGLEFLGWLLFYPYIKKKAGEDQSDSSKKIRIGIIVYIMTMGTPIIVIFFIYMVDRIFSPFPLDIFNIGGPVQVNALAIFLNILIVFMIFSNYLIGLFFQFRMVNGILNELKR